MNRGRQGEGGGDEGGVSPVVCESRWQASREEEEENTERWVLGLEEPAETALLRRWCWDTSSTVNADKVSGRVGSKLLGRWQSQ